MRYAVIADIHANHEALDAVLTEASRLGVDKIVCCGDVVGYHADPDACIARLRSDGIVTIAGNHDLAAAGLKDPAIMWDLAEKSARWTRRRISAADQVWLAALPRTAIVDGHFLLIHGALHPREAPEDLHLEAPRDVRLSLEALTRHDSATRVCFFGHTHKTAVHQLSAPGSPAAGPQTIVSNPGPETSLSLDPDAWYLINPGSVGLPRDGRPGAAFAVFDSSQGSVDFLRVPYDETRAREKCRRAGLTRDPYPVRLAKRALRNLGRIVSARPRS